MEELYLDLYFRKQEDPCWCWAATSQAVIYKMTGRNPTQAQIVTNIFGSPISQGANAYQETQSLAAWGVGCTYVSDTIPFSTVVNNIKNGKPIRAGVILKNGAVHSLLIYGYYNNSTGTDPQLYYYDPLIGNPTAMKYSNFVSNNEFNWVKTHYDCYQTY